MSLALVTETVREVRRLAAAGSDLARGDFRLERLREPLATAAAKVPVFGKIAEAIGALTTAGAPDTPDRLLALTTLVHAVLATQAETGVGNGELRPLATTPAPGKTTAPFRQLEPVLAALSTTGSGRLEIVKTAFEQGHFSDLRLAAAAVRGLGDPLADIAAFMAETVVPSLGPTIAPLLRAGLDLQGGKAHARRLQLLARFVGPAENALYREAAETGSKEVKIEAAAALRHNPASATLLRELAKKGSKELRAAALGSLVHLDPAADIPLLVETLRAAGGDEIALPAVRSNPSPALTSALVAAGRADLPTLLATPAPRAAKLTDSFLTLLRSLGNRPDPEGVTAFLAECLEQTSALAPYAQLPTGTYPNIVPCRVARVLLTVGTPRALELLAGARGRFDAVLLAPVFRAAVCCQTPTEVFDGFAPYLDHADPKLRDAVVVELTQLVTFQPAFRTPHGNLPHQANAAYDQSMFPLPGDRDRLAWDPRWRARLMALDGWKSGVLGAMARAISGKPAQRRIFELHEIVAALSTPKDPESLRYLEAQLDGNLPTPPLNNRAGSYNSRGTWYGEALVLLGLIQGGHPRAAELLAESAWRVSKLPYIGYQAMVLREVAGKLPTKQLGTLLRLAGNLPEGDPRREFLSLATTPEVASETPAP